MNVVTLEKYVDQRFEDAQIAINKAAEALTARLESNNGHIELLKEQSQKFISREEVQLMVKNLNEIGRDKSTLIFSLVSLAFGFLSLGITVIGLLISAYIVFSK